MSKYKRVWAMVGVVGLLGSLMALAAVAPTPAGAQTPPANTVTITKIVNGTYDGAGATFGLAVTCEDPDGNGPLAGVPGDNDVDFEGGGSVPTTGGSVTVTIPAVYGTTGAQPCRIFELNRQNADIVTMQATTSTPGLTDLTVFGGPAPPAPEPQTFVNFDPAGGQNVSAFIVNTYLANTFGRVDITKEVDGAVPVGAIFQFHVQCGAYGADAVLVGEGTVSVPVPTAGPPQGAGGCTPVVTEPVAQPAPTSTTFNPPALSPFPADSTATRTVTVTNTYPGPVNRVTVTKNVIGTPPANAQYTVQISCAGPGAPYVASHVFNAGESYTFDVPANAGVISGPGACTVAEIAAPGAPQVSVVTFPVLSGIVLFSGGGLSSFGFANGNGGHTARVEFTNRYISGPTDRITVNKSTVGTVPAGTPFLVRIQCSYDIDPDTPGVQNNYFMAFGQGQPETQSVDLPASDLECSVSEINSGGATSVTYASGPASTGTQLNVVQNPGGYVLVNWESPNADGGESAQVNIVNTFPQNPKGHNTLRIKKQLRGRIPAGATFTIRVRCTGGGITDVRDLTFTTNSFQEISVSSARTDCRVTEIANGGAQSVEYIASSATADVTDGPNSARVDFGNTVGGQRAKVKVRNTFPGTCPRPGPKFC